MNILFVTATKLEVDPFLEECDVERLSDRRSIAETRKGINFTHLISGVGLTATAFWLGRELADNDYELVINCGICGSLKKELEKRTVVQVTSERFADLGAQDLKGDLDLFEMGLLKPNEPPFTEGVLTPKNPATLDNLSAGLHKVRGISVNQALGRSDSIKRIKAKFDVDVVNMEGAAVFYSCILHQVPVIQIRSVSDLVGPRDKQAWDIKGAVQSLSEELNKIFLGFIK